ncbi:MAG: glycosyltransferase N-terminal domain-containing protein [bacterium]|nr:glycosyltransferase N-terminal domain-containing protein [bacterium]
MRILYFITIKLVEWLLPAFVMIFKSQKLKLFLDGQKQTSKLAEFPMTPNRYWFHCASLGEFEQARPVIENIKRINSEIHIVISFFSPSGYELRKNYELAEAVFYLPLDTPANAKKIIEKIKPTKVIFIKYEIWPSLLKGLFLKNVPVYLISANFRQNQAIFGIFGQWLFKLLPQYKHIFLQNRDSYNLLKSKGLTNISISGDTRFDRVLENAKQVKKNEVLEQFKDHQTILILGSSWPKEEELLFQYLQSHPKPNFKIIIAPHDISDKHIEAIQHKFKEYSPQLFTNYTNSQAQNILILNTIGHLASAYYYADMAFIGGGFTGQLHNILEPLSFGVPVFAGPIHTKFPEAEMAKLAGIFFDVSDLTELDNLILKTKSNNLKKVALAFIDSNSGATLSVVNSILQSDIT